MRDAVIVSAVRTPIGSFQGALATVSGPKLGAVAIRGAVEQAGIEPDAIDEVIMGCVLQGGVGQAPARQAAIFAGLPSSVPCTTINKVCGSGLKTVMMAYDLVRLGEADVVVAGGMENMTQAPYLLERARDGYRLGHGQLVDLMINDGLWDVYNDFHMGTAAEMCAREHEISREDQDSFSIESYRRALAAIEDGLFVDEIVPVDVPQRRGDPVRVTQDEEPGRGRPDKIPSLRPVFDKAGTITAANASSINDGAAAVVIMSAEKAAELGCTPLVRIGGYANHAQAPEWFTTAPAKSIQKVLDRNDLGTGDIDCFEINEAFAVVSLATNRELGLDPERVNTSGGAVALGHPIGASGTRILVTLIHNLIRQSGRRGIASLCIGGGEAVALLVEREN
ncbi:MAG: acetyl-CoA C-acyltransferase [Myxococcales bacterium]|nr:acetyl-CoA C-acyltransferase [Myxococcales bacterium]